MLANWMFFWTEADWVPAPPVVETPAENLSNAGGGGSKKRKEYIRADDEFWEIRERWLRAMYAPLPPVQSTYHDTVQVLAPAENLTKPASFFIKALPRYEAEKAAILSLAEAATTLAQLQAYGRRLIELNKVIQQARLKRMQLNKRKLTQLVALGTALIELLR